VDCLSAGQSPGILKSITPLGSPLYSPVIPIQTGASTHENINLFFCEPKFFVDKHSVLAYWSKQYLRSEYKILPGLNTPHTKTALDFITRFTIMLNAMSLGLTQK
jgi:hypothetical protein